MKTRNQVHLAIGLGAIALALVWPIHIDAKPMVECKDGKCVISEDDWNRYREFHIATRQRMKEIDKGIEVQNNLFTKLLNDLVTCQSRAPQREA
jgi:hypothetical protein